MPNRNVAQTTSPVRDLWKLRIQPMRGARANLSLITVRRSATTAAGRYFLRAPDVAQHIRMNVEPDVGHVVVVLRRH